MHGEDWRLFDRQSRNLEYTWFSLFQSELNNFQSNYCIGAQCTEEVGIGRALRLVHNIPLWTCRFHGWMNSRRPQIVVHMKVVSCSSFNFVAIMWRLPTCFHHVCQNFDRQLYRNLIESHGCPVIKKNNCNNSKLENETQLHLNSTTTTQHNFLCLDMDSL